MLQQEEIFGLIHRQKYLMHLIKLNIILHYFFIVNRILFILRSFPKSNFQPRFINQCENMLIQICVFSPKPRSLKISKGHTKIYNRLIVKVVVNEPIRDSRKVSYSITGYKMKSENGKSPDKCLQNMPSRMHQKQIQCATHFHYRFEERIN